MQCFEIAMEKQESREAAEPIDLNPEFTTLNRPIEGSKATYPQKIVKLGWPF